MLSFEPELESLRPLLGESTTDTLLARERRTVFSLQPELRIIAWAGAMLLATAAGLVLKENLERIGPFALSLLIGAAAVACYAFVWQRRARPAVVDDYVLLLGALLVSADAAFIESQYHLFGDAWYRHFLLLAVVHGAGAYAYRSRTLLTVALAAMAAWLGVYGEGPQDATELAIRAFEAAAVALMWRVLDARFRFPLERRALSPANGAGLRDRHSREDDFLPLFEHFAANLASIGAAALLFQDHTRLLGCLLALAVAAVTVAWGFRTRRELFVLYGTLYAFFAVDVFLIDLVDDEHFAQLLIIASVIGAIAALFVIHAHFRELRK
ncbi:MAG TPA: DUF2157 domain-containing protein [Thermoanaerobaculia bacterium]